ncbi:MAG: hypothetical protein RR842_06830 [Gordonibacter sp.]|uniref:hypothetical protein n=1 Tax=Gordonibacter sp. TaxID=1968902 RepID=UPI002FCC5AF2
MFDETQLAPKNGTSATITIKEWLLLDCVSLLNIIPILGSIACIVIYAIIAFGSSTAISMKNRVLASLVWFAIWFVIALIFLFAMGGLGMLASVSSSYAN